MASMRILNRDCALRFFFLLAICFVNVRTEDGLQEESGDEVPEEPATHVPQFLSSAETFYVKIGDPVTLQCRVDKLDPFFFIWYKGQEIIVTDGNVFSTNSRIKVIDDESIMIDEVSKEDLGEYKCLLGIQGGELSLMHHIYLSVPPKIHHSAPTHLDVKEGQHAKLTCKATGTPEPTIVWKNEGEDLRPISGKITDNGLSLYFDKIQSIDQGQYECEAHSSAGEDRAVFRVKVSYKPKIKIEQTFIPSGDNVKIDLTCIVKAEPRARVSWIRDGKVLGPQDGIRIKSSDHHHISIHISHLQSSHFGVYTCEAANELGQAQENTVLKTTPTEVLIKSSRHSTEENEYEIEFSSQSLTPVIEYQLLIRKLEHGEETKWSEVMIPSTQHGNGKHAQKYMIKGLDKGSEYEVYMKARNGEGWNDEGKPFKFLTAGEMEKHSKVSSTTEIVKESKSGLINETGGSPSQFIDQRSKIVALLTVFVLVAFF